MVMIELKRYYPYLTEKITLEVSEEIAAVLSTGGCRCDSYKRRRRERGECSLDADPDFEKNVAYRSLTPEEIIMDKEAYAALYAAIDQLPPVQARRIYAHYIQGRSKTNIAQDENVVTSAVSGSIRQGIKNLYSILKNYR